MYIILNRCSLLRAGQRASERAKGRRASRSSRAASERGGAARRDATLRIHHLPIDGIDLIHSEEASCYTMYIPFRLD